MIDAQYIGVPFRQLSHRLRIHRPGKPDKVSERPREGTASNGWGRYTDSDEHPTVLVFEEGDVADVAGLLKIGAIAPLEVPHGE